MAAHALIRERFPAVSQALLSGARVVTNPVAKVVSAASATVKK